MDDQIRPIFTFLILFILFSGAKTEDADVIKALVLFMNNLSPGNIKNTPNWGWNDSSDPCSSKWAGVTCDNDGKTVKKIVLEKMNLSGVLDAESVCKVNNLLVLSLSFNNITGNLQPDISNCVKLTHLYLNNNHFSGNLPDSITELPNVKRIVISNNEFTNKLPDFSRTTSLLTFLGQNNKFSGQIPSFNYNQLESFNVANNDLSGPIPDDTGRFDANSFAGNPQLCGKELPKSCPVKKKEKKNKLRDFALYSGYVILGLIVVVLIVALVMKSKKKKKNENVKNEKRGTDSGRSSGSRNSRARSEFSATSVESGGISSSMVVLSSPVVNGLRFEDLLRAPAELIGRGKHGSLYKVRPDGGVPLVVKRIKDWKISRDAFKKRMQTVYEIKHPNVLPLVAYYSSKQEKLLVYEFQINGSLFRLLHGSQNGEMFDWGSRLAVASSVASALAFMHEELKSDVIPHGNLKSSNILLKNNMEPCLSEYGLMSLDQEDHPDDQTATAFQSDVYAFGVVLLELLTGKPVQDNGSGLAKWVSSVVQEEWTVEVFDKALIVEGASEERMVGLLQVALKCVNTSMPPRMSEVAAMISSLKEEEERSMTSSDP